jgi:hypothetical protein
MVNSLTDHPVAAQGQTPQFAKTANSLATSNEHCFESLQSQCFSALHDRGKSETQATDHQQWLIIRAS